MSVEALGLATKQVVCVPSDMPTINAFAAMCASRVSSAGVVQLRGALSTQMTMDLLFGSSPHSTWYLQQSMHKWGIVELLPYFG